MRQDWRQLLFLHWRVSPELIQKTLPPGLTVDTFAGDAYIGLVPFTMRNVRPVWSPPVPGLSHFHEINVRTYVQANGEPGVWFYSLDAANPVAVAIARVLFHLPYYVAAMRLEIANGGGEISYVSQRRHPGVRNDESVLRYTPVSPVRHAEPGSLDHFLCERYLLYSQNGNDLYSGRVHHSPYPLQDAVLHDCSDTLVAAAGFPGLANGPPVHAAYAEGVSVEVFGLRAVVK
ncbi:MAG: DUF2071 domain-containing protein [Akkermansiaceae bacterium]|nr:DUF2071 domain-containing protein [Armatimonadota bacterium]